MRRLLIISIKEAPRRTLTIMISNKMLINNPMRRARSKMRDPPKILNQATLKRKVLGGRLKNRKNSMLEAQIIMWL